MNSSEEMNPMTTLSGCMNKLQEEGYKENFMVKGNGLAAMDSEKTYTPSEVKIVNFYRFEGDSDPADSAILYALETNDGLKGVLSDSYGAYADTKVSKFFADVEEIQKQEKMLGEIKEGKKNLSKNDAGNH